MAASRIFNALALVGAGYLLNYWTVGGYKEKMQRHNQVMEILQWQRIDGMKTR